jgi:predicted RNA binding protein YcfA (HicA-like mRNA interferase family)
MKPDELVKLLQKNGWIVDRQSGSHKTLIHPTTSKIITVPMKKKDLGTGLLHKLLKIAGLK